MIALTLRIHCTFRKWSKFWSKFSLIRQTSNSICGDSIGPIKNIIPPIERKINSIFKNYSLKSDFSKVSFITAHSSILEFSERVNFYTHNSCHYMISCMELSKLMCFFYIILTNKIIDLNLILIYILILPYSNLISLD